MRNARIGILVVCMVLVFVMMGIVIHQNTQRTSRLTLSPSTTPVPSPAFQWMAMVSPNSGSGDNGLTSIAAIDRHDAWTVGFSQNLATGSYDTLTEHWNGIAWTVIPSPNAGNKNNFLAGVAVVDAMDAWAVGEYQDSSFEGDRALIEHWNGTAWTIIPGPTTGNRIKFLFSVAAVDAKNVWAVGESQQSTTSAAQTLIEHWNGTTWAVVPSPTLGAGDNKLYGVSAVNANDIWADGAFQQSTSTGNQALIEHWNDRAWVVVSSPNPGNVNDVLTGISAVNATDVWAVGYDKGGAASQTLIEHWNGSSWGVIPSYDPGDGDNELYSLDAVDAKNVWAVGNYLTGSGNLQTLIEHWNGSSWSLENSPNPGNGDNTIDGIVAVDARHALAVGEYHQSTSFQTLIVQGNN